MKPGEARSRPIHRKATLTDVARRAGVSYQTVSRVINHHPNVASGTRARVQRAIEQLDYQPNRAARNLATRRSNTIGIVSFGAQYYGPTQMVVNIEAALKGRGFALTLTTVDNTGAAEMRRAIGELTSQNLDGIVMITPTADLDVDTVVRLCRGTPFVMLDLNPSEHVHSVAIDQQHGATLATKHLLDLGHARVCHISGPLQWHDARLRRDSWLATVLGAGAQPGPSVESDWTAAGGYAAAGEHLRTGVPFSALFVANDQMALGAIRALRDAGRRVPEDVSIVGFDDVPEAAFYDPPLTTVRQDFEALGQQSIDYLTTLIDSPETPPHQRVLYPRFVVRSSTAAPADDA